jgi:short-subunit dehydrogenase
MPNVVVVTGGGAGVGRAVAQKFAERGDSVALIGRDEARLEMAAAQLRQMGVRAAAFPADVAEAAAVEQAADAIEAELGPINIWVNNAMATVFAAVAETTPEEFLRGTQVTYLGTVHGTMAALKRMRSRNSGAIVNVGSALAYRSVPLQAVCCGAKSAIRGFTDSLRSEIIHDRLDVHLTMVHLPAVNTPQFGWARNKTGHKARPVPPVFDPDVPARAIVRAATSRHREIWVGWPTVQAILANRIAPGFADRYLAKTGYTGQMLPAEKPADAVNNLFAPVAGDVGARGTFGAEARSASWEVFATKHRYLTAASAGQNPPGAKVFAAGLDKACCLYGVSANESAAAGSGGGAGLTAGVGISFALSCQPPPSDV